MKVEEIYAAGGFGREVVWEGEGEKKLMGNAGGLVGVSPKNFESQVLYSVYFPFSEQFFESIYDVKSTNIYFHCHLGRV